MTEVADDGHGLPTARALHRQIRRARWVAFGVFATLLAGVIVFGVTGDLLAMWFCLGTAVAELIAFEWVNHAIR